MARVQYSHPTREINVTKPMIRPPKKKGDLKFWLRASFKVHPEAPQNYMNTQQVITDNYICLEFEHPKNGDKFALVIER